MRSHRLLTTTAVLMVGATLTVGAAAQPAEPRVAAYSPHRMTAPVPARAQRALDRGSRREVQAAYRQLWRPADETTPDWIGGDVDACKAGELSGNTTNRQLGAINFARLLAGLNPLALDTSTVEQAQAAAIIMTAKNAVSHYPPESWPCWTQIGHDAASMSNLYQGVLGESNAAKMESYLDDWGPSNRAAGHRRWFLYPQLTAIGLGGTATANVSYLFGQRFNEAAPNPEWVSWPTAGWFPNRLDPRGRWSLSGGSDDTDFSQAQVKVTFGDRHIKGITLRTPEPSPGKPTLVWEMPSDWPISPVGKARVTVSGIVIDGVAGQSKSYAVKFFRSR